MSALRLGRTHQRLLCELYAAEPDGLAAYFLFDSRWLGQLVDNGLVEPYIHPNRTLSARYRLTRIGRIYEPIYRRKDVAQCG